jgi:hypothetical protein
VVKKWPEGFGPVTGIQRQCKLIEERPGMKTIPGKGSGGKTDCPTQATNSPTMNERSGSVGHGCVMGLTE